MIPRPQLFIGGQWCDAEGGARFAVEDPSTGEPFAEAADASVADGRAALDAAVAAQDDWAATAPRDRAELLRAAFEALTARTDEVAHLMTREMGKSVEESAAEVAYGAEFLRWFSEEAVRTHGRYATAPNGASRLLTLKQPVGPCLMITPWNFPLAMATRKIAPALAAGCTVVVKPASLTPLTTLAFAALLHEAGVPPGVVNVVTTSRPAEVISAIIADPRLRKLTFTGSSAVGRTLVEQSAPNLLRVSMELGGNAPFLVFDDADLDAAVDGAVVAKLRNLGEACTAANRFLVHESLVADFADRLARRMAQQTLGPLVERRQREKVAALVDDAIGRGARALTGGHVPEGPGWFYPPTVLVDVPPEAQVNHEEIFGPVAPVTAFRSENEALAMANATPYGLVAYVYTRDHARALRVSEALEVGMVGLNQGVVSNPAAPFGGVKQSGFGREGGFEGIDEYLNVKYVGIAAP